MLEKNTLKTSYMDEQILMQEDQSNIEAIEEMISKDPKLQGVKIKQEIPFNFEIYYLPVGFDLKRLPIPQRSGYRFLYWSEVNICKEEPLNKVKDLYRAVKPCWQKLLYLDASDIEISLRELNSLDEEDLLTLSKARIVGLGREKNNAQIRVVDFEWPDDLGSYDLVLGVQGTDILFTVQVEVKEGK